MNPVVGHHPTDGADQSDHQSDLADAVEPETGRDSEAELDSLSVQDVGCGNNAAVELSAGIGVSVQVVFKQVNRARFIQFYPGLGLNISQIDEEAGKERRDISDDVSVQEVRLVIDAGVVPFCLLNEGRCSFQPFDYR